MSGQGEDRTSARSQSSRGVMNVRVLVAEDTRVPRMVLLSTLTKWGYDIIVAHDGTEAWNELQKPDSPSLLILDWEMPGIDGIELCRRIRSNEEATPHYIILLTGRDSTADLVAGLDAGANDYVTKPFAPAELQARVEVGRRYVELLEELTASKRALEHLARTDSLTQTLNRGAIMERLDEEVARAKRNDSTLGLGIFDVDHFKRVNDTYGHVAGDETLREVVRRVAETTRLYDGLGRLGGEEFLMILPGATPEDGQAVFERARQAVCACSIDCSGRQIDVTISLGGAISGGDESADEVMVRADEALYRAKQRGRNRVEMAESPAGPRAG